MDDRGAIQKPGFAEPNEFYGGERDLPPSSSDLTFRRFSEANRVRCESPGGFNHALASWSLSDWFTATVGELGEAANVAKKLNRVRDGIPGNRESEEHLRWKLKGEIADAFIYLDLLAQAAGFSLGDAVIETFDRKSSEIGYPVTLKERP